MTLKARLRALTRRAEALAEQTMYIAQPWLENGPATPQNRPTRAQIAAHHQSLREALARPGCIVIDRPDPVDIWQVRPILDADKRHVITIQRSYGTVIP